MSNNRLFSIVFDIFQKVLLKIDPHAFDHFGLQQNKIIKIQINGIGEYYLQLSHKALSLIEKTSHAPDCELSGPLSAYLDILFKYKRFIPGKGIHISGQVAIAQALFEAFKTLDPDWATQFEKSLPKPLVALGGHIFSQFKSSYQSWQKSRTEDIKSYLQNETAILAPSIVFQQFSLDVIALQNRVRKLEQQYQAKT